MTRILVSTILAVAVSFVEAIPQAASVSPDVVATSTVNGAPLTTPAFPTAQGDLLVAFASASRATGGTFGDSRGLGWTPVTCAWFSSSVDVLCLAVALTAAPAGSGTVTFIPQGFGSTGAAVSVLRVAGMTRVGAAAIRQVMGQGNMMGSTPSPMFAAPVLTTNPTLGAVACSKNPAGILPPSGWVEWHDVGYTAPTRGLETTSQNGGFVGPMVLWGSTAYGAYGDLIVELDASP